MNCYRVISFHIRHSTATIGGGSFIISVESQDYTTDHYSGCGYKCSKVDISWQIWSRLSLYTCMNDLWGWVRGDVRGREGGREGRGEMFEGGRWETKAVKDLAMCAIWMGLWSKVYGDYMSGMWLCMCVYVWCMCVSVRLCKYECVHMFVCMVGVSGCLYIIGVGVMLVQM